MKNYKLYTESTTPRFITLETLDSLLDTLEHDGILALADSEALNINNMLSCDTKEDKGLSAIDGSIMVNDNTLAYFGHDVQPTAKEIKAFDFIIKQTDTLDVTTLSIHRKGSFMYERLLTQMFSNYKISNETLADIDRQDKDA